MRSETEVSCSCGLVSERVLALTPTTLSVLQPAVNISAPKCIATSIPGPPNFASPSNKPPPNIIWPHQPSVEPACHQCWLRCFLFDTAPNLPGLCAAPRPVAGSVLPRTGNEEPNNRRNPKFWSRQ